MVTVRAGKRSGSSNSNSSLEVRAAGSGASGALSAPHPARAQVPGTTTARVQSSSRS